MSRGVNTNNLIEINTGYLKNYIYNNISTHYYSNRQIGVNLGNLIAIPLVSEAFNRSSSLTISCINAQSLRNKTHLFVDNILDSNCDICLVTETWFSNSDTVLKTECTPASYNLYDVCRENRRGGGTALLCKDYFKPILRKSDNLQTFEFSLWEIKINSFLFNILILYRPPSVHGRILPFSLFLNEFSQTVDCLLLSSNPFLICGDFNIHIDTVNNNSSNFIEFLNSSGLINHVHFSTHIHGHTLDLLITREYSNIYLE